MRRVIHSLVELLFSILYMYFIGPLSLVLYSCVFSILMLIVLGRFGFVPSYIVLVTIAVVLLINPGKRIGKCLKLKKPRSGWEIGSSLSRRAEGNRCD
jgi:hypothetical protein